jgi:hypothetical protein
VEQNPTETQRPLTQQQIAGMTRSEAKAEAARSNGKKGGRPRKFSNIFMPRSEWEAMSPAELRKYKAEIFRYYRENGFPYYKYTLAEKRQKLAELILAGHEHLLDRPMSILERESGRKGSKWDGSYFHHSAIGQSMHGLSLAWSYFKHSWSIRCNDKLTPLEVFQDDRLFTKAIEKRIKYGKNMSDAGMRRTLRVFSGAQSVSNFRPTAAAAIYHEFLPESGGTVWDMSAGFGGRLLGAISCHKCAGTSGQTRAARR